MKIFGQNFFAGTRSSGYQNTGVRRCNLIGKFHKGSHGIIAENEGVTFIGNSLNDSGDQISIRRQGNIFLGTRTNGVNSGPGIIIDAAGNNWNVDVLGFQPGNKISNIDGDIDHQQISALAQSQGFERAFNCLGLGDPGTFVHGHFGGGGKLSA